MRKGLSMNKKQIINIINFIRGIEPRADVDLLEPVREQISLMKKYNFKGTFLIQYDALIDQAFTNVLKGLDQSQFEIGVWFEVVQPMAEKAGLEWRGRFPWDWHAHCGFSVGYTPAEREALVDVLFEEFKVCFGYYPRSFGSWAFDAHTLDYANSKYGLDAACNCKEQWGTDGYNLWGGYYGQGYYPSKYNAFCPAQTKENQINTPVFRMLGSDPIHQYDSGLDIGRTEGGLGNQGVFTLEPVYTTEAGGGIPWWVDWYFSQNFSGNCLTFGYAQAGQENSFGWDSMKNGLEYQFEEMASLVEDGKLVVETLQETGLWYKENFPATAVSTITALEDWSDEDRRSVWYDCKNYRLNLYAEKGRFWIRDIYIFDEKYTERYLDKTCKTDFLTYDNLPFVDGNRFSGNGKRSGLYPITNESDTIQGMEYDEMIYQEKNGEAIVIFTGTPCGDVTFTLSEKGFSVDYAGDTPLLLAHVYNDAAASIPGIKLVSDKKLELSYDDFVYNVELEVGLFTNKDIIKSEGKSLSINL